MGNALRGMLDKAYIIVNQLLGAILVRAQEEKRRAVEKTSVLENTLVILNEVLVEIWMIKVILMRSQTEMRKMSLETRRQ